MLIFWYDIFMQNKSTLGVVLRQREYYARTAAKYDAMHVDHTDPHERALNAFVGLAETFGRVTSVLDVGAGTGRGMLKLIEKWKQADIVGIEPVGEPRKIGHAKGISSEKLIPGDAQNLSFNDNSFDWIIETGVLHHVPSPLRAVAEMTRVAKTGIMISDSNNVGQGRAINRNIKYALNVMGLWLALEWLKTKEKMYRYDEIDGVSYLFLVFSCISVIKRKFPNIYYMNTGEFVGYDYIAEPRTLWCSP